MTEFDRFFGKKISMDHPEAENILTLAPSSAEECSLECAERLGKCLAFHVCLIDAKPTCTMLLLSGRPTNETLQIRLDQLEESSACTTFIVAKGSQLHSALLIDAFATGTIKDVDRLVDSVDEEEQSLEHRATEKNDMQSWASKMFIIGLGICIGYLIGVIHKRYTSSTRAHS